MSNPWGNPQPFDPNQPSFPPPDGTSFPPPEGTAFPPPEGAEPPIYPYPQAPGPAYPGAATPFPPPYLGGYPGGYPAAYPVRPPDHPQAVTALVLGILGLVCCGLASPFAIWLGRKAMNEIDASGGQLGGRGQAQAGFIMGIIGTALWALGLLFYAVLFVFGVFAASNVPTY